jgi:hypothetical protein
MATIACVTCVTPNDVSVDHKDNALIVKVDGLGIWIDGLTQPEQLRNLAMIANKLLNAHDSIAAQARLFDGEA